jgi:hypothetical protein
MRARTAACIALVWSGCALADYVPRVALNAAQRDAAIAAKSAPDENTLAARLDQARLSAPSDPLRGEAALQQILLRLRETVTPQDSTRATVEALVDHSPLTYTDALDDERARGALNVPAFAIGATARGTLRRWDKAAHIAALERALHRGDPAALRAIDDPGAWLQIIAAADDPQLQLLRMATPDDVGVRAALALRVADTAGLRELLAAPANAAGLALIARLPTALPPQTASTLLRDPALDRGYVSAARLALARLPWDATIQRTLLQTLADADGASSAQALAADPRNLPALRAVLERPADALSLRRALLALRWMEDAGADATLAAFSRDPAQAAALRDEARQWLR